MKRQITATYISQEEADKLEKELEFSKYVSESVILPRAKRDKVGYLFATGPMAGPLREGEVAYIPTLALLRDFLSEVYKVHVFVYPMFGDKLGYDSWELAGCKYHIADEDEYGLVFLTYDDLNEWLVSGKYLVDDTWAAEEEDRERREDIFPTYEIALREGLKVAMLMITREDQYKTWKELWRKRKKEFDEAEERLPNAIWFQTPDGDATRRLLLEKDGDHYKRGDTWAKIKLENGQWFVTESSSPRLVGHIVQVLYGEKSVAWARETFKKWWKEEA